MLKLREEVGKKWEVLAEERAPVASEGKEYFKVLYKTQRRVKTKEKYQAWDKMCSQMEKMLESILMYDNLLEFQSKHDKRKKHWAWDSQLKPGFLEEKSSSEKAQTDSAEVYQVTEQEVKGLQEESVQLRTRVKN